MGAYARIALLAAPDAARDRFDADYLGRAGRRRAHRRFSHRQRARAARGSRRPLGAAQREARALRSLALHGCCASLIAMVLPLTPDYPAMEAKLVPSLPEGPQWQYEPKWDGFRCLAFKDRSRVALRSKSGQPLDRYFPEIVDAMLALNAPRCVLDGELVVPEGDVLSFDQLLMRIHPAASRVQKLSREHPALYVVFDLLVDEHGQSLVDAPLAQRRIALERFAARELNRVPSFRLSPVVRSRNEANAWLEVLGSGLDGVVAKRVDLHYQSGT